MQPVVGRSWVKYRRYMSVPRAAGRGHRVVRPSRRLLVALAVVVVATLLGVQIGFGGERGWSQESARDVTAAVRQAHPGLSGVYAVCVAVALEEAGLSPVEAVAAMDGSGPAAGVAIVGRVSERCR